MVTYLVTISGDRVAPEKAETLKCCQGKTPIMTFLENVPLAKEKFLDMKNKDLALAA
jgi:hypothetical protein